MPEVQSRSYANPRRLPRRNHYQEGPGFLFVATQGGRPPDDDGLRNLAGVVRRRRAALRRWADGDPLATFCAEFRCSRASLFRWRTRFERDGLEGLLDRPRVGRRSDLPTTVEPRSPAARRSRRGRGGRHRLRRLLQLPPAPRRARLADTG